MSYDLTIWKWAVNAVEAPNEVFEAIAQDEAHPAIQRFDVKGFLKDLYAEFGGEENWSGDEPEPPFIFQVGDFTGTPANWIIVNLSYGQLPETAAKLVAHCLRHNLVVFDHQTRQLYEIR
jgi:hypothetical protein